MSKAEEQLRKALNDVWAKPSPELVKALRQAGYVLVRK